MKVVLGMSLCATLVALFLASPIDSARADGSSSISLRGGAAAVVVDLGPDGTGGYAAFEATDVRPGPDGKSPVLRISYACHPDGLGEKGDFWKETAATYLGKEIALPILPANINRYELYTLEPCGPGAPARLYRAPLLQGLVRYVRFALDTKGASATIRNFRLVNDKVHSEGERAGSFSCSDARLNAVWEASVRTCELCSIPSYVATNVAPPVVTRPYLADGAKRDRLVWSGDLWWAERNVFFGFRPEAPYMKGSLDQLAANQTPEGYVQACPWPEQPKPKAGEWGPFPSDEFAAWFVPVLCDYVLYTGDRATARRLMTNVKALLAYLDKHCRADGLFEQRYETSKHASNLAFGSDSTNHRSYMDILLWKTRVDAAQLADWIGEKTFAASERAKAERLARAIRAVYWDAKAGEFREAIERPGTFGWHASALALAAHFATPEEAKALRDKFTKTGHGKFQALGARGLFEYGYAQEAMKLITEHGWFDAIANPSWKGLHLTSECMGLVRKSWGDEAHPDTALAGVLSNYILGAEPLEPGWKRFRVRPRPPKGIVWAKGTVPTPSGEIKIAWEMKNGEPAVTVEAPKDLVRVEESAKVPVLENVAHRGLWQEAGLPQNTVEAIRAAYEAGARTVETDFIETKSGEIICLHDKKALASMSSIVKNPDEITPEDRARINLGEKAKLPRPYRIPVLSEVLAVVPKRGILQAEIKGYGPTYARTFDAAVRAAGLSETNIVVSSFKADALEDFHRQFPSYRTLWLGCGVKKGFDVAKLINEAKRRRFDVICPSCDAAKKAGLSKADVDRIRAAGFDFRVFGVNSPGALRYAADVGASGFTCNTFKKAFEWAEGMKGVRLQLNFAGIFPKNVRTVYVVAPSSHADNRVIRAATNELVRCGYRVKVDETVWTYAADPAERARALERAWRDPETDLVICSRGGSGGADTVARLDFDILKSRALPFVGFSNISTLMNAFVAKGVRRPVTAPSLSSLVSYPCDQETIRRMGDVLAGRPLADQQLTVLRAPEKSVSGKPIGGHWPSISRLAGEFLPDTTGRIAFLEVNKTYTVKTACESFLRLKARGYFDRVAAVVLCDLGIKPSSPIADVAAERRQLADFITREVKCPVFAGFPYGHVKLSYAIDFDRKLTISPEGVLTWQ